ncbi:MAG: diguanylate cyclase [Xanthomonadales bacterium]|nr:diguanylate cyclase [Xanthomonadales bacterium]
MLRGLVALVLAMLASALPAETVLLPAIQPALPSTGVSCVGPEAAFVPVQAMLHAPAGGWPGKPVAVVVANVLAGEVRIEHGGTLVCGNQWDSRSLDSRFRAGVGAVLTPVPGSTDPIELSFPETATPWLPPVVRHGDPATVQRGDTGRFVTRIATTAVITAMALSALLSFVGLREPVFLAYGFNVLVLATWLSMLSGLWGYPRPWLPLGSLASSLPIALPLVLFGGTSRLVLRQGGMHRMLPWLDDGLRRLSWLLGGAAILVLVLPLSWLPVASVTVELVFTALCLLLATCLSAAIAMGRTRAAYALVTILPFLAIALAQVLAPAPVRAWKVELLMLACAWFVLSSSLVLTVRLLTLRRQRDQLQVLARTDELTGLANRRAILAELETGVQRARADGGPLAVAFIDIDHFKTINARLGHAGGDRVLVSVARLMRQSLRRSDRIGRLGGEEFLIILPGAEPAASVDLLHRLCRRIRQQGAGGEGPRVTASAGLTWLGARDDDAARLLARADQAMFDAKRAGRDRVEVRPPPHADSTAPGVCPDTGPPTGQGRVAPVGQAGVRHQGGSTGHGR